MEVQKDLEALRKAAEDVSSQINTILLFRTALMILLTVLLARALVAWGSSSVQETIEEFADLGGRLTKLEQAQIDGGTRSKDEKTRVPRVDPISLLFTPDPVNIFSPSEEMTQLGARIDRNARRIRDAYWNIFGVEVSLLGTKIQFDLRVILLLLPLFGPVANVYLYALRHKRRHLIAIGQARLQESQHQGALAIDPVTFGESLQQQDALAIDSVTFGESLYPWIFRYPASILNATFWASALTLIAVCGIFEWEQATSEDRDLGLVLMNVTVAAFLIAMYWGRRVENRIRLEVFQQTRIDVPADPFNERLTRLRERLLECAARLRPRPTVITGSLLILLTLALNIGQTGCDHVPERGYEVARLHATYAADLSFVDDMYIGHSIAQAGYIALLVLACFALVLMFGSLGRPGWARLLAALTAPLLLFVLSLHASNFLLPIAGWLVYWLAATVRYGYLLLEVRRRRRSIGQCASMVLTSSGYLLAPLVCCLAVYSKKYLGLPAITLGVTLLSAGAYAWMSRGVEPIRTGDAERAEMLNVPTA
jgi:hypothetical protein